MAIEQRTIKKTFDLLLGKDVTVEKSNPIGTTGNVLIATYANEKNKIVSVTIMDLSLSCYSAAALSLLPANIAEDAIRSKKVEEPLFSNAHEVFNVGVSIYAGSDGNVPDMRLGQIYSGTKDIPVDVQAVLESAYSALSVKINIPGYGAGVGSFYLA